MRYQTALHSDFLYLLNFIDPHAVWFQLEFGFRSTRQVRYSEFIRLAGSHQQFVQQYYTKKIKNQTNFYEKFQ